MFVCTHNASAAIYSKCSYNCGDGKVVSSYGEICDDGSNDGFGCNSNCTGSEVNYTCTGGDLNSPSICKEFCGDGIVLSIQPCDDGNLINFDGCSSECTIETGFECIGKTPSICTPICGDGLLLGTESCDDGNKTDDRGCNTNCNGSINGFICSGGNETSPTLCNEVCGDGNFTNGEGCDD